ncbi:ATP-dependent RNA helicase mtr4 [Cucumispora dikerogammari]|nr:ATP-dependent RNA helicase mtr4 [Cucumispora dikerogammari]
MEEIFNNLTNTAITLPNTTNLSSPNFYSNIIITDKFFINNTYHSTVLPTNNHLKTYTPISQFSKDQNTNISQQTKHFPYMSFKYILDPFQKISIEAITKNESVLVAAHTSSGKTVVAEYAISMAIKNGYKVIYTSPIKALSNQKFRDLSEKFNQPKVLNTENDVESNITDDTDINTEEITENIGLCTGDVTLNPTATCIVMTTEILRNLLYRGSDLIRDVKYVIFDEVHYLKDKERGVVWEECISLLNLPEFIVNDETTSIINETCNTEKHLSTDNTDKNIKKESPGKNKICCIFLSATIPNSLEFSEWISNIHQMPCHEIFNSKRPIPLSHYVVPSGGEGMYKIVDSTTGSINYNNLHEALRSVKTPRTTPVTVTNTINLLITLNKLPCIVFSFARKDCELYAMKLNANLDFLNTSEKKTVKLIYKNAIQSLTNPADRELPAVKNMLPMLLRGIGIHHSGLVPVIREIIEILFSENLIQLLFCTETFSIGLNVPAKSVLFTAIRKFDGLIMRCINGSEYMQMSGRAGRRGLDKEGTVVSIVSGLTEDESKMLFGGKAEILISSFSLGCNMVLNLIRSSFFDSNNSNQLERLKGEEILKRTFFYFLNDKTESKIRQAVEEKENRFYKAVKDYTQEYNIKEEDVFSALNKLTQYFSTNHELNMNLTGISSNDNNDLDSRVVILNNTEINEFQFDMSTKSEHLDKILKYLFLITKIYKYFQTYDINNFLDFDIQTGSMIDVLIPQIGNPIFVRNCYIEAITPTEVDVTFILKHNQLFRRTFKKTFIHRVFNVRVQKSKRIFNKKYDVYKERTGIHEGQLDLAEDLLLDSTLCPIFGEDLEKIETSEPKVQINEKDLLKEHLPISSHCYMCKGFISIDCIDGKCPFSNDLSTQLISLLIKQLAYLSSNHLLKNTINNSQRIKYLKISESLFHLNYLTKSKYNNSYEITLKGRVACEIRSGSEILLTEMLFNNSFDNLTYLDICALISCFVCTEFDSDEEKKIKKADKKLYLILVNNERKLNEFFDTSCNNLVINDIIDEKIDCKSMSSDLTQKLSSGESAYSSLLMHCCRAWAQGATFGEICSMTNVFEGSIIRILRRLEEVLRQMSCAARVMGNNQLEALFSIANSYIKRDIVFNNSLYL